MRKLLLILLLHVLLSLPVLAADYAISVSVTGNGSVVPNKTTGVRGDTITLTVTPDADYALLEIEARLASSVSGGLNIFVKLLPVDATHYAFVLTADTDIIATFVRQPIDSLGRLPYALYLADQTLFFLNTAESLAIGDPFLASTITALWSGVKVAHTPTSSSSVPGWNALNDMNTPLYAYRRIVFDESFSAARPTSLCNWFSVYDEGPTSIEGLQFLNTSEVTSMLGMFWDCSLLSEIDVSHFDTRNVTNMAYMFSGCNALQTIDVSNFNMHKVKNIRSMFYDCKSLEQILCDDVWDVSASRDMFHNCPMLYGAVAWSDDHINSDMANPYTGYFTFSNGDLDGDGQQTSLDVQTLVSLLLQKASPTKVSDINKDGRLSLSDVTTFVNRLSFQP